MSKSKTRKAALKAAGKPARARASWLAASFVALLAIAVGVWKFRAPRPAEAPLERPPDCSDKEEACSRWADAGECEANPTFMHSKCPVACGACGGVRTKKKKKTTKKQKGTACRDADANCGSWASAGECDKNPAFMHSSCPVSCMSCPEGDEDPACVRVNKSAAATEGGITAVFERALREYPQYNPQALSQDPWVMTFDDFLSDEEAERFIQLCASSFERSLAGDQLSPVRTSHQCWCQTPPCVTDDIVKRITERIGGITMTPSNNAEVPSALSNRAPPPPLHEVTGAAHFWQYFQVVRYEVGQFYKIHHDQNSAPFTPQGARLFTFFMYLNT